MKVFPSINNNHTSPRNVQENDSVQKPKEQITTTAVLDQPATSKMDNQIEADSSSDKSATVTFNMIEYLKEVTQAKTQDIKDTCAAMNVQLNQRPNAEIFENLLNRLMGEDFQRNNKNIVEDNNDADSELPYTSTDDSASTSSSDTEININDFPMLSSSPINMNREEVVNLITPERRPPVTMVDDYIKPEPVEIKEEPMDYNVQPTNHINRLDVIEDPNRSVVILPERIHLNMHELERTVTKDEPVEVKQEEPVPFHENQEINFPTLDDLATLEELAPYILGEPAPMPRNANIMTAPEPNVLGTPLDGPVTNGNPTPITDNNNTKPREKKQKVVGTVDKKLKSRLIEMFPQASPDYINEVCRGKLWEQFDEIIEVILSNPDHPKRPQKPQSPPTEIDPEEQFEIVKALLPDADPTYLRMKCEELEYDPTRLTEFVNGANENKGYPTMKEYLRKQQLSAQSKQYTSEFNIEKFIELFPDPEKTFSDPNRNIPMDIYKRQYLYQYFGNRFDRIQKRTIWQILNDNEFKILATNNQLIEFLKNRPGMRAKRKHINVIEPVQDILLLQELAYLDHQKEIEKYIEEKRKQEETDFNYAKENNLLNTCECCFDDEVMPNKTFSCPQGHLFCKECLIKSCEVALGEGKTDFRCMVECTEEFTLHTLQNALAPKLFSKLAQKKQLAEIKAAGLDELESCPFCDFATILNENDKIFCCLNPECMKESCRKCKEPNHIPLSCEEIEKDEEVKTRTYIENKMTEALLRKCWQCGKSFYKDEGCNKMTCTCGAQMCYICQKPVKDYSHFNGLGGENYHLCPLYSDTNQFNQDSVLKAANEAKAQVDAKKLKVDPSADVVQHFKERKKALPHEPHLDLLRNMPVGGMHIHGRVHGHGGLDNDFVPVNVGLLARRFEAINNIAERIGPQINQGNRNQNVEAAVGGVQPINQLNHDAEGAVGGVPPINQRNHDQHDDIPLVELARRLAAIGGGLPINQGNRDQNVVGAVGGVPPINQRNHAQHVEGGVRPINQLNRTIYQEPPRRRIPTPERVLVQAREQTVVGTKRKYEISKNKTMQVGEMQIKTRKQYAEARKQRAAALARNETTVLPATNQNQARIQKDKTNTKTTRNETLNQRTVTAKKSDNKKAPTLRAAEKQVVATKPRGITKTSTETNQRGGGLNLSKNGTLKGKANVTKV